MCTTIYVLNKNKKNFILFHLKIISFTAFKNHCILHRHVFIMTIHMNAGIQHTTQTVWTSLSPGCSALCKHAHAIYSEFHGCKNVNFQMIFKNIFLIFAINIDCGYTLEPPQ